MQKTKPNTALSLLASFLKTVKWNFPIRDFVSNLQLCFQPFLINSSASQISNQQMLTLDRKTSQQNSIQVSKEDVKLILNSLGMCYSDEERFDADEIKEVIDELPISLEEVKEAFDVFDENKDGFIDARELQRVLRGLGLQEGTELEDCRKMIMVFNENCDELVDFSKFVRFF